MGDIFSKYTATPTKTIKKLAEEEDAKTKTNKFSGRIELSDGLNKLRIGPRHPGEESFMHMRAQHWIPIEKDGETVKRTVPNGRIHGGLKEDIVEAYVAFCSEKLATGEAEDAEKITKLTAYPGGLNLSTGWVSYAMLIKKEGRGPWEMFEYGRTIREDFRREMVIEDSDEAIELDILSPPKTGRSVLLTYNPKSKNKKEIYKVKIGEKAIPLSVGEMTAYDKLTPISKLPEFNYNITHFELAIQGIKNFDSDNEIDLFDSEEFTEILKKIRKEVKALGGNKKATTDIEDAEDQDEDELPFEDGDEDEKPKKGSKGKKEPKAAPKKPAGKKVVEEEDEEDSDEAEDTEDTNEEAGDEADQFEAMDRAELKAYKTEKGWDDIKVFKTTTDEALREAIRAKEAEENEGETDSEDEAPEEDDEPEEKSKKLPAGKGKLTLDDIKANLNKKKK